MGASRILTALRPQIDCAGDIEGVIHADGKRIVCRWCGRQVKPTNQHTKKLMHRSGFAGGPNPRMWPDPRTKGAA